MAISLDDARSWYPRVDPVHGFDHVMRVYEMAERIASREGADLQIVQAAALLHDAQPPVENELSDPEQRSNHQHSSAAFAREILESEAWSDERIEAVLHCIRSHRFRDQNELPRTLEAKVLFDADKLDAIGAIGVIRAVAYAVRAGQAPYAEPSERFRETMEKEPGEQHTAYHEFLFKLTNLKDMLYTTTARQIAEERHHFMTGFFERLAGECSGEL